MNIKDLLKNLAILTLHALLVAIFGLALMSITALTDYAAGKLGLTCPAFVTAIKLSLEIPFVLGVLRLSLADSAEAVKHMYATLWPAAAYVRQLALYVRSGRSPGEKCLPAEADVGEPLDCGASEVSSPLEKVCLPDGTVIFRPLCH